jgi:hypothetical protein
MLPLGNYKTILIPGSGHYSLESMISISLK